jgi:hypothetical protein
VQKGAAKLAVSENGRLVPTEHDLTQVKLAESQSNETQTQSSAGPDVERKSTSCPPRARAAQTASDPFTAIERAGGDAAPATLPASNAPNVRQAWREVRFRNRIVNGDMRITHAPATGPITPSEPSYVAARWLAFVSAADILTFDQARSPPLGFASALEATVHASYEPVDRDLFELQQAIEGFKIADFGFGSEKPSDVTLSFWVKASLPGSYNAALSNAAATRSYVAVYDVQKAHRWERKTIVLPGDSATGGNPWPTRSTETLVVSFNLGASERYRAPRSGQWSTGAFRQTDGTIALVEHAGASLALTGVQLEAGPAPTSFEERSPEIEALLAPILPRIAGEGLAEMLPHWAARRVRPWIEDYRTQALLRRAEYLTNRIIWIPYVTAYDWFRFHREVLADRHLFGESIGVVAWARGLDRYPTENQVFKYQYGVFAVSTATANAVYFADAYLNFGWIGVVLYSLMIGVIFHVIRASRSLPLLAVSVMSTFGLMVGSFPANVLSGGLFVLVLLAWLLREPERREP